VLQELLALLELRVTKVRKVTLVLLVQLELKESKARKVILEPKEIQVPKVYKV
tara:strand:- start:25 stop:183 length:159 start_codon:yes stop_codon:yes gene_type:complete